MEADTTNGHLSLKAQRGQSTRATKNAQPSSFNRLPGSGRHLTAWRSKTISRLLAAHWSYIQIAWTSTLTALYKRLLVCSANRSSTSKKLTLTQSALNLCTILRKETAQRLLFYFLLPTLHHRIAIEFTVVLVAQMFLQHHELGVYRERYFLRRSDRRIAWRLSRVKEWEGNSRHRQNRRR